MLPPHPQGDYPSSPPAPVPASHSDAARTAPSEAREETPASEARVLTLRFHATAAEYFRIWIVNLCLTLLTLGVFSAWAKVRKKRYFYAHVQLDGTPFQYLGQPLPILRGRVIAVVLFLVYYLSSHFFTFALPYVLAVGLLIAPWVIVRSAAFNARYSAYRNLTFRFDADYRDAVRAIYVGGLLPMLVIGTMFDWWGNYYLAAGVVGLALIAFPWWLRRLKYFLISRTQYGGVYGEFGALGGQFFRIYLVAAGILLAVGLAVAFWISRMFSTLMFSPYGFLLALLPLYLAYVVAFAYVQAHSTNLVWNHTRLGPISFRSTLRGRHLAALYLTNALGILASAGLLIPWAVVRTLRYRLNHLQVFRSGPLSVFHGDERRSVRAAGAEVGDFFDVDLSL